MAKGCMHFRIEKDEGEGWRHLQTIRDTEARANRMFHSACSDTFGVPLRLVKVNVLEQRNISVSV